MRKKQGTGIGKKKVICEDEKMFLYGMRKYPETGFVEIRPMNGNAITIHGEKEVLFFIQMLIECFQS